MKMCERCMFFTLNGGNCKNTVTNCHSFSPIDKRKPISKAERKKVFQKCGGRCAYCGCEITEKNFVVEHYVPFANGGDDNIKNMLPSCKSCNHYKSTYGLELFRKQLQLIPSRLERDSVTYRIALRYGLIKETKEPIKFYFERIGL